jgi:hypothetical protein
MFLQGTHFAGFFYTNYVVNAPVNVVKTLEFVLCSSRDGVPLGLEKDTCRQTSLSKWIN